jgi:hypothetical protein
MNVLHDKPRPTIRPARQWHGALIGWCLVLGTLTSTWGLAQEADPSCGNPFVHTFGPHDYRVEQGRNRKIVEDYHFTPRVESLISGLSGSLGADIDFTLRAFPNHHRALISMMNLGARLKSSMPPGAQFSVECYFKRALQFRRDDTIVRMIYAKYLASTGRKAEAVRQLEIVVQSSQENGFTQYNAGLIYFEMGEFDKALLQAHRALSLGFEMQGGLKQQLQAAGKWSEPASVGQSDPASAAVASPAAPSSAPTTLQPAQ